MFSCTWQEGQEYLQFAIKKVGLLTDELHAIEVGQKLGYVAPMATAFQWKSAKARTCSLLPVELVWLLYVLS